MVTDSMTTRSLGLPDRGADGVDGGDHVQAGDDLAEQRVLRRQPHALRAR